MKGVGGGIASDSVLDNRDFKLVGTGFPTASALIGVFVLIGWITSTPFMVQLNTTVPMVIITALVMVLTGIGGVFWSYDVRRPAFWLGLLVTAIGVASAFGYLTDVDVPFMAELCGKTEQEVTEELAGVIFRNPVTQAWVTADEYLSGNVREKLATAETFAANHPE